MTIGRLAAACRIVGGDCYAVSNSAVTRIPGRAAIFRGAHGASRRPRRGGVRRLPVGLLVGGELPHA
jgi:hypothetical protein